MHSERPFSLLIRTAVPHRRAATAWGDYHFACSLAKELVALGHSAVVQCRADVERTKSSADAILTIRGRVAYPAEPRSVNLAWVISHPDRLPSEELATYDHVFVASRSYAESLKRQTSTQVSVLLQATDPVVRRLLGSS